MAVSIRLNQPAASCGRAIGIGVGLAASPSHTTVLTCPYTAYANACSRRRGGRRGLELCIGEEAPLGFTLQVGAQAGRSPKSLPYRETHMTTNTTITPALLDQLLANYEKPEDLTGDDGLFKQLKKADRARSRGGADRASRLREGRSGRPRQKQ
jgi:hypothetical protein